MSQKTPHGIYDLEQYRENIRVFRDRVHAGDVLARMLDPYKKDVQMIMAIPAGGVPVGVVVAEKLDLQFDVAVVSKITLPWNTEAGYGAVAFDGTVRLNKALMARIGLSEAEVQTGIEKTIEWYLENEEWMNHVLSGEYENYYKKQYSER